LVNEPLTLAHSFTDLECVQQLAQDGQLLQHSETSGSLPRLEARAQIGQRHPTKQNLLRGVTVADFAYYTRPGPRTARTIISVGSNTRYHEIYTGSKPVWAFGSQANGCKVKKSAMHRNSKHFSDCLYKNKQPPVNTNTPQ
jgi:hypothetical protein